MTEASYTFDRIEIDLRHGGLTLHGKFGGTWHPIRITADDDPAVVLDANRADLGAPESWIDARALNRALVYRDHALADETVMANLAERDRKRQADAAERDEAAKAEQQARADTIAAAEAAELARIDEAVRKALAART